MYTCMKVYDLGMYERGGYCLQAVKRLCAFAGMNVAICIHACL